MRHSTGAFLATLLVLTMFGAAMSAFWSAADGCASCVKCDMKCCRARDGVKGGGCGIGRCAPRPAGHATASLLLLRDALLARPAMLQAPVVSAASQADLPDQPRRVTISPPVPPPRTS